MNVVKLGNKPYLCILKESTKVRKNILRGGAVVARWAHNPKVIGSNPVPATQKESSSGLVGISFFTPPCNLVPL